MRHHHTRRAAAGAATTTTTTTTTGRTVTTSAATTSAAIPSERSVWRITRQGAVANLQLQSEPMPELQPGQVLVEVAAVGLNFADVFCCLGLYAAAPKGAFIPGLEFAGVVVAVHPEQPAATAMAAAEDGSQGPAQPPQPPPRVGDRVIGVTRFGAYASHVALGAGYVRPLPPGWSLREGAAFAVQALTAAQGLLALGDLEAAAARRRRGGGGGGGGGPAVLVQSAAGGVGLQALAICQAIGARVLALVGSDAKAAQLEALLAARDGGGSGGGGGSSSGNGGATATATARPHVAVRARARGDAAIRAQLRAYLAEEGLDGFDVFLDSAGGEYLQPGFDALAPCGRHVIFGAGTLTPPPGARLERGWRLLWPPTNLLAALRLAAGWLSRPRLDVLSMPGRNTGSLGFNLIYLYERADLMAELWVLPRMR